MVSEKAMYTLLRRLTSFLHVGINYHTVHDQFRVFDTLTESWEATELDERPSNTAYASTISSSVIIWIILGCIGFIIVSSYGAAIWTFGFRRFHTKVKNVLAIIKREAWKPRFVKY